MTVILERRKSLRRRVFKGAKLFFHNFMMSVDCTIRNESGSGMQITVDPDLMLSNDLSLLDRKEGTIAPVQVIWRHGSHMGVALLGEVEDVRRSGHAHIRQLSTMIRG
nr:hypothetical protein [uncultured Cohaesibacter sp.]